MGRNFNGSTDILSRSSGNPTITSFTMMAWVRFTSFPGWALPLSLGQSGGGGTYYAMGTTATTGPNNLVLTHPGGQVTTTTPSTATWYHLAMTVAGTGASQFLGYRDGVNVLTHSGNATPTNAYMGIGNNTDSDYLNGDMCAVKVYNAVLTAAEILQEMRQIAPVRTANINTWLPLVDGSPTVDYSGVGGNMTSGGTVTATDNPPIPWRCGRRRFVFPASAPPAGTTPKYVFGKVLAGPFAGAI